MRHIYVMTVAAALWLCAAPEAGAQIVIGTPGFGGFGVTTTYGYGMPYGYGISSGYGYVMPYGGYGYGFAPNYGVGVGAGMYRSTYSAYVAPGTTSFYSGYAGPGFGYGMGTPAYGGMGYGFGYGGLGRSGYVATSPFMGLPRPNGGLIRVPR